MTQRSNATEYLAVVLDDVLATAGMGRDATGTPLVNLDVLGQLKEPLDATDRAMAFVTTPETDAIGREAAYTALAEYFTLLRARKKIALRFPVNVGGDAFGLDKSLIGINVLIEAAYAEAVQMAGLIAVSGGIGADATTSGPGIGGIELDWSGAGDPVTDEYGQYANWSSRW